jgi:hypothetical protein
MIKPIMTIAEACQRIQANSPPIESGLIEFYIKESGHQYASMKFKDNQNNPHNGCSCDQFDRPQEWVLLGKTLRGSNTIRSLNIEGDVDGPISPAAWHCLECLYNGLKKNTSIETLTLFFQSTPRVGTAIFDLGPTLYETMYGLNKLNSTQMIMSLMIKVSCYVLLWKPDR